MKKYTEADLKNFEQDDAGRLICPSGDYTEITCFGKSCSFGEWCSFGKSCNFGKSCSFGEWCSFGESCSFGEWCSFGESCNFGESCILENNHTFEGLKDPVTRVLKIDRIGSRKGCTYFFKTITDINVRCGCFLGTISEFEEKVKETHRNSPRYLTEYLGAIEYVKKIMEVDN